MKLANKLLQISSFNLEGKCDKETFVRLTQFGVSSFVLISYFVVQSIFAIALMKNLTLMLVSIAAAAVLAINLSIIVKQKHTNGLSNITAIVSGLALLYVAGTGNISIVGTLILGLFPFFAISMLGYSKGGYYSIAFGILFIASFFLPASLNPSEP